MNNISKSKLDLEKQTKSTLELDSVKIIEARHSDPFSVLGRHKKGKNNLFKVYMPHAESVKLGKSGLEMQRVPDTDFFEYLDADNKIPETHYLLSWVDKQGTTHKNYDPYDFEVQTPEFDQHLFAEGKHWHLYKKLGAHLHTADKIKGVLFAVWAPNAERISIIGDFNQWDGRCHSMRQLNNGIWEIFIPGLEVGCLYKFEIVNNTSKDIFAKTDPFGQQFESRPNTSSIVFDENAYTWKDKKWIKQRESQDWLHQAASIYEVHLGSWRRDKQGNFLSYREAAPELVAYVKEMGFTHIELLPITEHPLDASWGYQTTGYFAPTSRHGSPDDFRYFVDYCHQNDIGVYLDWVPAHFPKDFFALARFDGTALYEHDDPRQGEHRDWGTLIYNYGRNEVRNFLLASAIFWMEEFHIDGLRVDAVASMLYLDYSREDHDWIPNKHGGNENLEAIEFLRELNTVTHDQLPGTVIMAEESTSWPQVTRPTWTGGLGFSMKWNMGWMHDILCYMGEDPVHRMHHHDQLTFGMLYAFSENFILPFSHDEVVHGKGSLLDRMPGDDWQRFANLRLLYTMMFTYPGKKLLFMGCEFGQGTEWNFNQELDWYVLEYPAHQGIKTLVKDLNQLYKSMSALHYHDFDADGFDWLDCHDVEKSIICYIRKAKNETLIVALNFTPVPRENYRVGVPEPGIYHEIFNSDSEYYNGTNFGTGHVKSEPEEWMNHPQSVSINLPPLAGIVLKIEDQPAVKKLQTPSKKPATVDPKKK